MPQICLRRRRSAVPRKWPLQMDVPSVDAEVGVSQASTAATGCRPATGTARGWRRFSGFAPRM